MDRISEELTSLTGNFKTVSDIHHVIGKLFKLVAADRIPIRNAHPLAYLAQLLLIAQKDVRNEVMSAFGYDFWEKMLNEIFPRRPRARPQALPPAQPRPTQAPQSTNAP